MSYAVLRTYAKSRFLTSNEAKSVCSALSLGNTYGTTLESHIGALTDITASFPAQE
jgi:hypothetical protein